VYLFNVISMTLGQHAERVYLHHTLQTLELNGIRPACRRVYDTVKGCTVLQKAVQYCRRLYSIAEGCTVLQKAVQYCRKVYLQSLGSDLVNGEVLAVFQPCHELIPHLLVLLLDVLTEVHLVPTHHVTCIDYKSLCIMSQMMALAQGKVCQTMSAELLAVVTGVPNCHLVSCVSQLLDRHNSSSHWLLWKLPGCTDSFVDMCVQATNADGLHGT